MELYFAPPWIRVFFPFRCPKLPAYGRNMEMVIPKSSTGSTYFRLSLPSSRKTPCKDASLLSRSPYSVSQSPSQMILFWHISLDFRMLGFTSFVESFRDANSDPGLGLEMGLLFRSDSFSFVTHSLGIYLHQQPGCSLNYQKRLHWLSWWKCAEYYEILIILVILDSLQR